MPYPPTLPLFPPFAPGPLISVDTPSITTDPPTVHLTFRQEERSVPIYFRLDGAETPDTTHCNHATLPLALMPAMKCGSPLRIPGPLDAALLRRSQQLQEIFHCWFPDFKPTTLEATPAEKPTPVPSPDRRGVGLFLSGGVDSTYSLLKHKNEITHAIFVYGLDIPIGYTDYLKPTLKRLRQTTDSLGIKLIVVETDLPRFCNPYAKWAEEYHGAGLAAIAHLLAGTLQKMYIASTHGWKIIAPWGSSQLTDPLWSATHLEIVNDGGEKLRTEKIETLAAHPELLSHLRVCFETPEDGYNCGRCEKCARTMVGLELAGAPQNGEVFDQPLDLAALLNDDTFLREARSKYSWNYYFKKARKLKTNPKLLADLKALEKKIRYFDLVRTVANEKNKIIASEEWRDSLPKFRGALLESLREEDSSWFQERILKWLPNIREQAVDSLFSNDRSWFRKFSRKIRFQRFLQNLRLKKEAPVKNMVPADPTPDKFDERAKQYTAERVALYNTANDRLPSARETERSLLIDRLRLSPGLKIVDAVAGGGYVSQAIYDRLNGDCHIIAFENSQSFADTIDPKFHPIISSLGDIKLPNASADRICCLAGLHHQENKRVFFEEAYRILRPGGILAVADALEGSPPARFLNGPVDQFTKLGHDGMFPAQGELARHMAQSGFMETEERFEEYHWPFLDEPEMVAFCRDLFRMHQGSIAEVKQGIREHLKVFPLDDGGIGMKWGLLYASAVKPPAAH